MLKLLAALGIHLYRDQLTGEWSAQIDTEGFVMIVWLVFALGVITGRSG